MTKLCQNLTLIEIGTLIERFVPQIFQGEYYGDEERKEIYIARMATKTVPKYGTRFLEAIFKLFGCRNPVGLRSYSEVDTIPYHLFEEAMDCFTDEDLGQLRERFIYVLSYPEKHDWILYALESKSCDEEKFRKIVNFCAVGHSKSRRLGSVWHTWYTWYKTQDQGVTTADMLRKLSFLCEFSCNPPDLVFYPLSGQEKFWSSSKESESFFKDLIEGVIDSKAHEEDLVQDYGFSIKNFILLEGNGVLTNALQLVDEQRKVLFKKRHQEIIQWYLAKLMLLTSLCSDIAVIILDYVGLLQSLSKWKILVKYWLIKLVWWTIKTFH